MWRVIFQDVVSVSKNENKKQADLIWGSFVNGCGRIEKLEDLQRDHKEQSNAA